MRSARPNAAVVLPLPGPVLTTSSPFSIVLPATSASWTALRFSIFSRWRMASAGRSRRSSGRRSWICLGFDDQGQPGHHQHDRSAIRRERLMKAARPRRGSGGRGIVGHDPWPTSFETTPAGRARRGSGPKRLGLAVDVGLGQQKVVSQRVRQSTSTGPGATRIAAGNASGTSRVIQSSARRALWRAMRARISSSQASAVAI